MRRYAWVVLAVSTLLVGACPAVAQRGDGKAVLVLESQPEGADILIDGDAKGLAPRSVEVAPGSHKIQFVKQGFQSYEKKVTVKAGEKMRLRGTLKAAVVKAPKGPATTPKVARADAATKADAKPDKKAPKAKKEKKVKPIHKDKPAAADVAEAKGPRGAEAHDLPHADMDDRSKAARAAEDGQRTAAIEEGRTATAEPTERPKAAAVEPIAEVAKERAVAPKANAIAAAKPVAPAVREPATSSGPSLRTIGFIGLGVGALLTGGAVWTNLLANKNYDSPGKAGKDWNGLVVGMTQVDARSSVDRGNTYRTVSSVLYVLGGTAMGVSAFLIAFGDSDVASTGQPVFAMSPIPGGGVLSVQGGF